MQWDEGHPEIKTGDVIKITWLRYATVGTVMTVDPKTLRLRPMEVGDLLVVTKYPTALHDVATLQPLVSKEHEARVLPAMWNIAATTWTYALVLDEGSTPEKADCTCSTADLMTRGCTCGAIKPYKARSFVE